MKNQSQTRENYLKCILRHSGGGEKVSTNTIAKHLGTSAASVTDMLRKLKDDNLIQYEKYKGASLTKSGKTIALKIQRKHRLWEVFLVEHLSFSWDNVHDIAEQLEHIDSPELIKALDKFLDYPKFDPHGDPIPSESGEIEFRDTHPLSDIQAGEQVVIASVKRSDPEFLQYLEKVGLTINRKLKVVEKLDFDNSIQIEVNGHKSVISGSVGMNLLVLKEE